MSGYLFHVVYIYILSSSSMSSTSRLEVRAIFQPSFLPGVAKLASMARSGGVYSEEMSVKDEEFSADYGEENLADYGEENQADDDMGSPESDRTDGEPLMNDGVHKCRASMLLEFLNSDFREKFAKYTEQEAKDAFLKEPDDFRTAAMLHFLYTNAHEAFEELHLGPDNDPANASGKTPQASDARASGEPIKYQHISTSARMQRHFSPAPPERLAGRYS